MQTSGYLSEESSRLPGCHNCILLTECFTLTGEWLLGFPFWWWWGCIYGWWWHGWRADILMQWRPEPWWHFAVYAALWTDSGCNWGIIGMIGSQDHNLLTIQQSLTASLWLKSVNATIVAVGSLITTPHSETVPFSFKEITTCVWR